MPDDLKAASIEVENAAYVAPTAVMFGRVRMEEGSSIWTNSVIRSEHKQVQIGRFSNIQDLVMIHVGARHPTVVGNYCSITHRAVLHGCTIEDYCLIGIGSIIMDGAVIGKGSIVAGNTFVAEGTIIPPGSIVMGSPGKVVREKDSSVPNIVNALLYHRNAMAYAQGNYRAWVDLDLDALKAAAGSLAKELGI
jgi:carbonic anhydrase/acetyltransferase-like protein (isoleucine patch superfamily)